MPPEQIAKSMGLPLRYVTKALSSPTQPIERTPERIIELYKQGKTKRAIAAITNIATPVVAHYIKQYRKSLPKF